MSGKLWGGRFDTDVNQIVNRFNASISFDQRLFSDDIEGSIAHATMLGKTGIIPTDEADSIVQGLKDVRLDIEADPSILTEEAEDIHMNVETLLRTKIGSVAGKLHTGRSRNDQVATDLRLWTKREIDQILNFVVEVQSKIIQLSDQNLDTILAGMTHMQHAQPVRLAHHLLAYFWMLERDKTRLRAAKTCADILPLGSGALAGTTFPIDREFVRDQLGFASITQNSMDAVSDRDFVLDTIYALSTIMLHLSRLCEEIILWNSPAFGYIILGDSVTTGSSIMPQKKNPDVAEHVRGKAGRVYGSLLNLLTVMKGLPLTYNGDLQEDKEALFDAVDTVKSSLQALAIMLGDMHFNQDKMKSAMYGDFSTATDLADFLVTQGLPFRDAHEVVGKIVGSCVASGAKLEELSAQKLTEFSPLFVNAPPDISSIEASVERRTLPGGTGRASVVSQLNAAKGILGI